MTADDHRTNRAQAPTGSDDPLVVMYDALGYVVRELAIAHDTLDALIGGTSIESLPGAIIDVQARIDRVWAVAAELRGRYA